MSDFSDFYGMDKNGNPKTFSVPTDCVYCGYFYQDPAVEYPRCHYDDPVWPAPCEEG
jgi:hypothetical protein